MLLNKGLWISISLDGNPATISRTLNNKAFLTIYGPERVAGDVYSRYHPLGPEGLPKPDDQSAFAFLYRKLETLVQNEGLLGPHGEDHPLVYNRFEYVREGTPQELLELLEKMGTAIRVEKMDHQGDDAEVEQAKQDFGRWLHEGTTYAPNPKVEEARKYQEQLEEHRRRMAVAEIQDNRFRRFVLFPILFAVIAVVLWGAFSLHWVLGTVAVLFIGFIWWWVRN